MKTIHNLIFNGGPLNWIIISMYFITLFVFVERLIFYIFTSCNQKKLLGDLSKITSEAQLNEIHSKIKNSCTGEMILEFIQNQKKSPEILNESLDRKASIIQKKLMSRLNYLSLIAAVAPLCGLLGTVIGLMETFSVIEKSGNSAQMNSLAGGIWVAMITTATGLIVAIPCVILHKIFESMAEKKMDDMSIICSILKEQFRPDCLKSEK